MVKSELALEKLWKDVGFKPNDNQAAAIRHVDGPLYLPAGPGSGKTRVLLWRAVNLIVFHGVSPNEIYLSTFTEKAALQLREGLRGLLGIVGARTGTPYDLAQMYVGTVHSLCQRILADRRFYPGRSRPRPPVLMDELGQYFYMYKQRQWEQLTQAIEWEDDARVDINQLFSNGTSSSASRHSAVTNVIALFNRLSEECLDPRTLMPLVEDPTLERLLEMYGAYTTSLQPHVRLQQTDFALLQQRALSALRASPASRSVFHHVIIDEYQDTNTIQERIFFELAAGHKNLCVVGDDDQALYRFRGATVENFVQFPERCKAYLKLEPTQIPLDTNYRSQQRIVDFYSAFIAQCNWKAPGRSHRSYRVADKVIKAHRKGTEVSVVASTPGHPDAVCAEVAGLVKRLMRSKKVDNPNQIAFLFPSLKSAQVPRMKAALEAVGLRVYAPRAGRFVEVEEAVAFFGICLLIFGKPENQGFRGHDYAEYHAWMDRAQAVAKDLTREDHRLKAFIDDRKAEIARAVADFEALSRVVERQHWDRKGPYDLQKMSRKLYDAPGLSETGRKALGSQGFERFIERRARERSPVTLDYVLKRATAIDWSILDLFYRVCGFDHFKVMIDLAASGEDEGPICNLGLISQYLARFMDEYYPIVTADFLADDGFQRLLFMSYLFAIFRRGESEYEDAEDPFPRGRIPFLTIHQAKGLEFPIVVLGNPRKQDRGPQRVEELVHPLLDRQGEPLDRMSEFDRMRMFYVSLSRAQNLLVIAHFSSQGNYINPEFQRLLDGSFPRIPGFDVNTVPPAEPARDDLPKNYSYTGDYLQYQRCPRQYMIFRRYGLVPSRSQTMMFGSLVHRTMDDLHQYLIARRRPA